MLNKYFWDIWTNEWMIGWMDKWRNSGRRKREDFKGRLGRVIIKKGPGESMLWWSLERYIDFEEEVHCLVQHQREGYMSGYKISVTLR